MNDYRQLTGPLLQAALEKARTVIPKDKRGQVRAVLTLEGVGVEGAVKIWRSLRASGVVQKTKSGVLAAGEIGFIF